MLSLVIAKKEFEVLRNSYIAYGVSDKWQDDWDKKTFAREVFKTTDKEDLLAREKYLRSQKAKANLGHETASWMEVIVTAHLDFLCRLEKASKSATMH